MMTENEDNLRRFDIGDNTCSILPSRFSWQSAGQFSRLASQPA
jgi:hypothetical protein